MLRPTMLVVEDDADHLKLTLTALQDAGVPHDIVIARDGLQALDYLLCEGIHSERDPEDQPELVLLDLGLPKVSGQAVMRRMREDPRTFFVPVVMLSSACEHSAEVLAFKGGLNSFISKPLAAFEFEGKLQEVREYWRTSGLAPLAAC